MKCGNVVKPISLILKTLHSSLASLLNMMLFFNENTSCQPQSVSRALVIKQCSICICAAALFLQVFFRTKINGFKVTRLKCINAQTTEMTSHFLKS